MKENSYADRKKETKPDPEETSLKGTFVSVLIIAAFMLLSWASVFWIFLERN
ncbi:cytochrome c oxidase subunit 2A [Alkalicoccus daliensis]|uniref:Cytochrome c oxidase subunit IIa family protein n=1 Tax=Alkalicoccus daliensis TaxID=745820 RepID=A0A1H0D8H0_9BACI|nr:cytochrome c oxidase subunit 2A [Alkalicoccus daliensis]SDN66433.1 Cytochrome c oxidase subunit IIa family protein [Alkalicoccus daliensis]